MKRLLLLLSLLLVAIPIAQAGPKEEVDFCIAYLVREMARIDPNHKESPLTILKRCSCFTEKRMMGLPPEVCRGE